jgi:hypothetical protein
LFGAIHSFRQRNRLHQARVFEQKTTEDASLDVSLFDRQLTERENINDQHYSVCREWIFSMEIGKRWTIAEIVHFIRLVTERTIHGNFSDQKMSFQSSTTNSNSEKRFGIVLSMREENGTIVKD